MVASNDVSQALDIIAQVPGDMLARDDEGWKRIAGGAVGQVQTSNGPAALPNWQSIPGGAGDGGLTTIPSSAASTSLFASKGWLFLPLAPLTVGKAIIDFLAVLGASYKVSLVRISGTLIDAVLLVSDVQSGLAAGITRALFDLNGTVALQPGVEYAMLHVRTDATATTSSGCRAGTPTHIPAPTETAIQFCRVESTDPLAGETVDKAAQPDTFATNFLYAA